MNTVMQVTSPKQYPLVAARTLEEGHVFDAVRDIDGTAVTIYPPDLVIALRIINNGEHLICRYAGGPLCVIARKYLKVSEVKLS